MSNQKQPFNSAVDRRGAKQSLQCVQIHVWSHSKLFCSFAREQFLNAPCDAALTTHGPENDKRSGDNPDPSLIVIVGKTMTCADNAHMPSREGRQVHHPLSLCPRRVLYNISEVPNNNGDIYTPILYMISPLILPNRRALAIPRDLSVKFITAMYVWLPRL